MVGEERYDLWWGNVLYGDDSETRAHVKDGSPCFWAEIDYIDDYKRILEYVRLGDVSLKNREEI